MKFERNKNSKRYFLYGLILVVVLTITVTFITSKANYRMTVSIPLTEGKVVASPYDINIVALYLDGVEQSKDATMPISGYTINEDKSYCYKGTDKTNKDTNVTLRTFAGLHIFRGISKSDKCILYFDKIDNSSAVTMSNLLENYYTNKKVRTSDNKDFNVSFTEATSKTVFTAEDNDGTSYYFAGNPTDNWVEFGGYYWRIIRVNGDGTIRMIYQGTEPNEKGAGTQIGISIFDANYNDNAYVGYWYEVGVLRGLQTPSNAYTELNNWFANSNIKQGSTYFNLIDPDAGFCGDRQPSTSDTATNGIGGTGTTTTYYGAYVRLRPGGTNPTASTVAVTPTLNCASNDDLYTYTGAKTGQGNHKLANPVGMITADEVAYAGLVYATSSSGHYLDVDVNYWTMSPLHYIGGGAYEFFVDSSGCFSSSVMYGVTNIRPIINLRSNVTFIGDGTISNPYKVA